MTSKRYRCISFCLFGAIQPSALLTCSVLAAGCSSGSDAARTPQGGYVTTTGVVGAGDDAGPATPAVQAPALRDAAGTKVLVGTAYNTTHAADPGYNDTAAAQFDFVTPENEMKWNATEPAQGDFTFGGGDQVVSFAQAHGMEVKGHNLVWNKQLPAWVSALSDATSVQTAMVNHINQVAGHYQGQVIGWDVVNEAWNDDGQTLKTDVFLTYLGSSYIDLAFQTAHAADPKALLFYNDFGIEGLSPKSDAVYSMVSSMKSRGIPIDGVGMQMHTQAPDASPSAAEFASNMARFAALGVSILVSEFDVELCSGTEDMQGQRFHDIVAACLAQPMCSAVTVWGVTDKFSWLNGVDCPTPIPLLFDADYDTKPAYTGFLNALNGQ